MEVNLSAHFLFLHILHGSAEAREICVDVGGKQHTACASLLVGCCTYGTYSRLGSADVAEHTHQSRIAFGIGEDGINVAVCLDIDKLAGLEHTVAMDCLI